VVPEAFGVDLSIDMLVIIIIGGAGSVVAGAVIGATVIVALPELLREYADVLPFISTDLVNSKLGPFEASQYLYGIALILILLVEPNGLVALGRRFGRSLKRLIRRAKRTP